MVDKEKPEVGLEQDNKYFRVILQWGTHKLHSEKLNLPTAFSLAYKFKRYYSYG